MITQENLEEQFLEDIEDYFKSILNWKYNGGSDEDIEDEVKKLSLFQMLDFLKYADEYSAHYQISVGYFIDIVKQECEATRETVEGLFNFDDDDSQTFVIKAE